MTCVPSLKGASLAILALFSTASCAAEPELYFDPIADDLTIPLVSEDEPADEAELQLRQHTANRRLYRIVEALVFGDQDSVEIKIGYKPGSSPWYRIPKFSNQTIFQGKCVRDAPELLQVEEVGDAAITTILYRQDEMECGFRGDSNTNLFEIASADGGDAVRSIAGRIYIGRDSLSPESCEDVFGQKDISDLERFEINDQCTGFVKRNASGYIRKYLVYFHDRDNYSSVESIVEENPKFYQCRYRMKWLSFGLRGAVAIDPELVFDLSPGAGIRTNRFGSEVYVFTSRPLRQALAVYQELIWRGYFANGPVSREGFIDDLENFPERFPPQDAPEGQDWVTPLRKKWDWTSRDAYPDYFIPGSTQEVPVPEDAFPIHTQPVS